MFFFTCLDYSTSTAGQLTLSAISFPPSANSNTKIFWYLQYKYVCQSKQFCFLTPIHDLPSSQEDKPLKLAPLSEQRAWPTQQKTSTPGSKNIHNVNFTSSSLFFFRWQQNNRWLHKHCEPDMFANYAKLANSSSTITIEIRLWCFFFVLPIQEVSIKYYVPSFCPASKCKSMLKKQICGILLFCKIPFAHSIINR